MNALELRRVYSHPADVVFDAFTQPERRSRLRGARLFLSGHTLRHTAQIEEVKAAAVYPK